MCLSVRKLLDKCLPAKELNIKCYKKLYIDSSHIYMGVNQQKYICPACYHLSSFHFQI